jgi:hypothetical protein
MAKLGRFPSIANKNQQMVGSECDGFDLPVSVCGGLVAATSNPKTELES